VPFARTAHEWSRPALIALASVKPLTKTGIDESVVVPLPSWPSALPPQQLTLPLAINAHV
jgi:hypothetical protein